MLKTFSIAMAIALFYLSVGLTVRRINSSPRSNPMAQEASFNSMTLRTEVKKTIFMVGEQAKITLRLTNIGEQDVTLTFRSSQKFDFTILDETGRKIFRWGEHMGFITVMTPLTLKPSEGISQTLLWNQENDQGTRVPAGSYSIIGSTAKFDYKNMSTFVENQPINIKTKQS